MDLQTAVVAIAVPACALYAAWLLAPSGLKRRAARLMLARSMPRPIAAALQRAATGANACGCDGCDAGAKKPAAPAAVPVTLQRRRP